MRHGLFLCFFCLFLACAAVAGDRPPDVFLITIDTLRADHVGCYGSADARTPALDMLARHGVRFAQAITPSPITNTSHASIFTGTYPGTHGVSDFGVPLSSRTPSWAEMLKNAGYQTAAFIGAVILDSKQLAPGFDRGFDHYENFPAKNAPASRWGRVERRGLDVVARAEKWLSAHPNGPRFVWVHLYDPHDPYEPPPPFGARFRNRPYDGEIAYADHALGTFLAFLRQRAWYEKSLIVVVGDHGEGLGEHGENTHGIFLYDATLHVPLILKLPGRRLAGRVVDGLVRTTDILPTVLELTGVKPLANAKFDGQPLTAYFSSTATESRTAIAETEYPVRFGWAPLRAARGEQFKYIEAPRPELYDLKTDPREEKNLYEPWNGEAQRLRGILAERRKAETAAPSAAAVPASTVALLQALGYLGTDAGATTVGQPSLLPDPKDKIEQQNLLHQAMIAAEDGRNGEARQALEKVLQLEPDSAVALLQLGQLELSAGNAVRSARLFQHALKLNPNDPTTAYRYGVALEKLGDLAGARVALESSLKAVPGQFAARLLLGQVCARLGDLKQAEDQLQAAVLLEPANAEAQTMLGRVLVESKQFQKAAGQLEGAARLAPHSREVFELLEKAYQGAGQPELARRMAQRAARLGAKPKSSP